MRTHKLRAAQAFAWHNNGNAALRFDEELLEEENPQGDVADIYNTYTIYLDIALALPVSLTALEKILHKAWDFLSHSGHLSWRHQILLIEADLLSHRGLYTDALKKTRESWSCFINQFPYYFKDSHLNRLTTQCLDLEDVPTGLIHCWSASSDRNKLRNG